MPAADTVLLPLCVGLTLLGVIATAIAWRRGNRGRVVQGIGLALAPIALYFSGLLRLLWDGIVAVATWAGRVVLSPAIWFGLSLLGLCLVLWVVGGLVARRSRSRRAVAAASKPGVTSKPAAASKSRAAALPATRQTRKAQPVKAPIDDDMAEIEALLKARGIE